MFGSKTNTNIGKGKISKNNLHIPIKDAANKNRTPGKSYVYRMNTSFSKDGSTSKNASTTVANNTGAKNFGETTGSNLGSLQTSKQGGISKPTRKDSTSIPLKKRVGKDGLVGNIDSKGVKQEPPTSKGKFSTKENISKRQRFKRDNSQVVQKTKIQSEFMKLKQNGTFKYFPKL